MPIEIPDSQCVKDAVVRLMMAKNPVILAGSSAIRNHASKAMIEFVNKLHIPVIHTMMAKGIIPFDNPYCLWTIGIPQKDYSQQSAGKCRPDFVGRV